MKRKIFQLAVLSAGVMLGNAAIAGTTVQNGMIGDLTVPSHQTNWATSGNWGTHASAVNQVPGVSFNKFDPTPGDELVQVQILVRGSWTGQLTAQNQSSAQTDTTLTSGSLQVRMAYDVFNDYDGATSAMIELSGLAFDTNYDPQLDTSDFWDNPSLPLILIPGGSAVDNNVQAVVPPKMIVYNQGDPGFDDFIGAGEQWEMGCFARSDDEFETSGGSPLTGHTAFAECDIEVTYEFTTPAVTGLACNNSLAANGDSVVAILTGDEECSNIQWQEIVNCIGPDLTYTVDPAPVGCTIVEGPPGTFNATCPGPIPANGLAVYSALSSIDGTDGICTSQVTSMTCVAPQQGLLTADTSTCNGQYAVEPPPMPREDPPPNVPTLSQWGLVMLAGLLGMIGFRASRRRS